MLRISVIDFEFSSCVVGRGFGHRSTRHSSLKARSYFAGHTEDENFQRLDQQNKYLQRRMNVKKINFYVKIFRRRRRNDEVENGLKLAHS